MLSIAREDRVDLRSRSREAKPRSRKHGIRTGECRNYKAILLNFYSIKAMYEKIVWSLNHFYRGGGTPFNPRPNL